MSAGTSLPEICSSQTVTQSVWRNNVIHTPTWRCLIFPCHNNIISGALVDDKQRGSLQARLDALFVFFLFFLLGPQTMSLLCRPSGWVHSHQSCSFPCVGQNRFLATGVNSCTLMGKALRKCTTKRNYSKQVWKHSSVVTGRGGDSGALVFTTYVHSSALTITLYLHLWATFTCACVCAYVLPCACVTWRPSALATASGFDLQSDTYRRNTNKQTNDGPDFTSQLEHFHKIGRKKGKRGHIWIWSTDTKVTSPSKIPQIEKRIFKVAVLFMSSGEM